MNIRDMFNTASIQLGLQINYAHFYSALRQTVQRMNLQAEKEEVVLEIAGSGASDNNIDEDDTIISDDDRIISGGRWLDGFIWNSDTNSVRVPSTYTKIHDLWYDDILMQCVPYETLKASSLTDYYFANINGTIYFAGDVNALTVSIKMRAEVDYSVPSKTDIEYTGMPESAVGMLMNGIYYILYSIPQYRNDAMVGLYRNKFEEDLVAYNRQVMLRPRQTHQDAQYTY